MEDGNEILLDVVSRGQYLSRRINSERVAVDPRVSQALREGADPRSSSDNVQSEWHQKWILSEIDSNASPSREGGGFWAKVTQTFASIQQHDVLLHVSPRIYAMSPACLNTLTSKLEKPSENWSEEERAISLIQAEIETTLSGKNVAVIDAGLIDTYRRVFHKADLFGDSYGGGKISSLKVGYGDIPTINQMMVASSIVSSWLALDQNNVIVLQASTHIRMNILLSCVMMYCTAIKDFESTGKAVSNYYNSLVIDAQSLGQHIHSALGGVDTKDMTYYQEGSSTSNHPVVIRPVARFVHQFACLLRKRDRAIASGQLDSSVSMLGMVVLLHTTNDIRMDSIVILECLAEGITRVYRPYFVLYDEAGSVIYSSLVHGIHSVALSRSHAFYINRNIPPGDVTLKMYHVPERRTGQVILECRINSHLLQSAIPPTTSNSGTLTLRKQSGDFDSIAPSLYLPPDFAIQLNFSNAQEEEEIMVSSSDVSTTFEQESSSDIAVLLRLFPDMPVSKIQQVRLSCTESSDPVFTSINALIEMQVEDERTRLNLTRDDSEAEVRLILTSRDNTVPTRTTRVGRIHLMDLPSLDSAEIHESLGSARRHMISSQEGGGNSLPVRMHLMRAGETAAYRAQRTVVPMEGYVGAEERFIRQLPTYRYIEDSTTNNSHGTECLICQYEYVTDDLLKNLPCFHNFHDHCIDSWLRRSGTCPVCLRRIDELVEGAVSPRHVTSGAIITDD